MARAAFPKGAGEMPRIRGFPHNPTHQSNSVFIAVRLWKDVRPRRLFARSARAISSDMSIDATPTAKVEKNNPDRTISTDRRAIADMRRINPGFNPVHYYPVRVPTVASLARLLVSMTVSFPGIPVEMKKRGIPSAFRLLRIHPALSLVMRTGIPGKHFGVELDIALVDLLMPFGRNGAPSHFAIFGDAVSAIHSHRGMESPGWFPPPHFLSKLYVEECLFSDLKNRRRQPFNTTDWESIARGMMGRNAINADKIEEEGNWGATYTMVSFPIDSKS